MRQFALACDNIPYSHDNRPSTSSTTKDPTPTRSTLNKQNRRLCPFDKIDHHPAHCAIYKNANLLQKRQMVMDNKLCLNCLGNHLKSDCKSQHSCRSCNRKHHSNLHDNNLLQTPRQHSEQPNDNNRFPNLQQKFSLTAESHLKTLNLQVTHHHQRAHLQLTSQMLVPF